MKKYRVKINGSVYEMEIEEISGEEVTAKTAADVKKEAPKGNASGEQVTAPMQGNINDVRVTAGQAVKKGDVLMILEAMKMENEIMAPCDGKIANVCVAKGETVSSNQLLCVVE